MIATLLDPRSLSDLMAELSAAGLPASDLAEAGRRFFRFEDDVGIVGYGGIEGDGSDRLLRSLNVHVSAAIAIWEMAMRHEDEEAE